MTEPEGKEAKGREIIAEVKVKLKAAGKREEDVAYERDGLQARLQQSKRWHDQVGENCTRV